MVDYAVPRGVREAKPAEHEGGSAGTPDHPHDPGLKAPAGIFMLRTPSIDHARNWASVAPTRAVNST